MDRDEAPSWSLRVLENDQVQTLDVGASTGELVDLGDEIAMAAAAVRGEREPAAGPRDGYWSVALCEAAQRSIESGREVEIEGIGD